MSGPVRVLQVVYSMGLGGVETWLMNVLRNIDRSQFQLDFVVYTAQPQFYDDEIRCLGAHILHCAHPARTLEHLRSLNYFLDMEGPYGVIHVHGSSSIGSTLKSAAAAQIPVRIAHGHNVSRCRPRRLRSRLFQPLAAYWLKKHLTTGLGASEAACAHLFGSGWKSDPRCKVLFYGIDWQKFKQPVDPRASRSALGILPDALVIGHVGRFVPQKNHLFLLEVASQVTRMKEDAVFLLVGGGELEAQVKQKVRQLGLEQKVIFVGQRADVPVMLQAMDVFLFPSLSKA
jgi:glycosyltransferase involved in cell wall biosynthesis